MVYAQRGDRHLALRDLDRAIDIDPAYPQARLHRANVFVEAGRHEEALIDLDLFLQSNPDYLPAVGARARAKIGLGRRNAALQDLGRAIELGAGPVALIDRGTVLLELERFEEARADAEEAMLRLPQDPRPWMLRGTVHRLQSGDATLACTDFRSACERGDCRYLEQLCR